VIGTEKEDRQYRRGMVLGLTMAEVLLLLLFLLLVIAAARIADLDKTMMQISAERQILARQLDEAQAEAADLKKMLGSAMIDVTKKYEASQARVEELERQIAQLKPAGELTDLARKLWPAATDSKAQAEEALLMMSSAENRVLEAKLARSPAEAAAAVVAATDAAVRSAGKNANGDLGRALAECGSAQKSLVDTRGQVEALKKQCVAGGKGMLMPPCWPDGHGGAQYIFDARLTENGIVLHDNKVPGREKDEAGLPIGEIPFDAALSPGAFQTSTGALLQLSVANGCRHYVRIFDDTGPDSKKLFQALLRAVEGSFYKLAMYNMQ
jgi:hypothetical protein